ncbi:hypothetical protein LUZ60_015887 [Juncus effusus]|nr:hypothetical protein LUZ60_015887 [Juncus effusus]
MVFTYLSSQPIQPLMEIMRFSLIPIFALYISLLSLPLVNSQADSCTTKLTVSSQIPFNTTGLSCFSAWSSEDFILRYGTTGTNLSFVLSAPDNGAYISIGFSPDGRMVGSSAIAGWVSSGSGTVKQYYLGGTSSKSCPPDQGDLKLVKGSPLIISKSSRLYLAFQLSAVPQTNVIYAVGPGNLPGSNGYLPQHSNMGSGTISFSGSGGTNSTTSGRNSGDDDGDDDETSSTKKNGDNGGDDDGDNDGRKDTKSSTLTSNFILNSVKRHGLFVLIGWGILMPVGVAMARFGKKCDPFWFYAHVSIQGIGFLIGTIGIIMGFGLDDEGGEGNVDIHKALGIVILVCGCLQVMAILARPTKESKLRRYWNWYHHYVGRGAILLAFVNIFYGFHISHENEKWSYIYGTFIGIFVVIYLVLDEWRKRNS